MDILRDDGCNTNVLSKTFVNKHRNFLNVRTVDPKVNHTNKYVIESTDEMVVNAEIEIGKH